MWNAQSQPFIHQLLIYHFQMQEKLDVMTLLVNQRNVDQVLLEFKEYATEVDADFVRKVSCLCGKNDITWCCPLAPHIQYSASHVCIEVETYKQNPEGLTFVDTSLQTKSEFSGSHHWSILLGFQHERTLRWFVPSWFIEITVYS
jgi:hypothetical protein